MAKKVKASVNTNQAQQTLTGVSLGPGCTLQVANGTDKDVQEAVKFFWDTLAKQGKKQAKKGTKKGGDKVRAGKHFHKFELLLEKIIVDAGFKGLIVISNPTLPGFFRASKRWDIVAYDPNKKLLIAIELKSMCSSFGNNSNNRIEETVGSVKDFHVMHKLGTFGDVKTWTGYLYVLADCEKSTTRRKIKYKSKFGFPLRQEFDHISYQDRITEMCKKLKDPEYYKSTCLLMSKPEDGINGQYTEPEKDINFEQFKESLVKFIKDN